MKQPRNSQEYQRFHQMMRQLVKVTHSDIKAELEREKSAKKRRFPPFDSPHLTLTSDLT